MKTNKLSIAEHLENFYDLFEYIELKDKNNNIDGYYAFKLPIIASNNENYLALSDTMEKIQTDNQTKYNQIYACISYLTEQDIKTVDELEQLELDDEIDSNVDVYTSDLTNWLNRDNYNVYYLTEAIESGDPKDGFQLLSLAQYYCYQEIWFSVRDCIVDFIKNNK